MVILKLKKQNFHLHKRPISIKNLDINKIVVSNKISFSKKGLKGFIGYKDTKTNRPLCASMYRTDFDENMLFLIWQKMMNYQKNIMKLCEPVYNEKHLKAKIKSYNGKTKTNFPNNKAPKEGSQCIFLISNFDRLCF